MKLLLLLSIGCIFGLACTPGPEPEPADTSTPAKPEPLTYLALGDSYTIGEAVPEEDRWPVQLTAVLRDSGIDMEDP